jgi:hypothetical protein
MRILAFVKASPTDRLHRWAEARKWISSQAVCPHLGPREEEVAEPTTDVYLLSHDTKYDEQNIFFLLHLQ